MYIVGRAQSSIDQATPENEMGNWENARSKGNEATLPARGFHSRIGSVCRIPCKMRLGVVVHGSEMRNGMESPTS